MALQNRVLPSGDIVAHPARGTLMGNRGILHDAQRRLGTASWRHPHWIYCRLHFKDRHRQVMQPGAYTELFFLDESVALAAGHRPCAECNRPAYTRFRALWEQVHGPTASAADLDRALHRARVTRTRQQMRHESDAATLPAGTFILHEGQPHLVADRQIYHYTPDGYRPEATKPTGPVTVLTPRPTVALLAAGYWPVMHPNAG
ncbi:hypothetical protein [Lacimonas salitolerans]|uniref:Uncharacterized protein n=1 Tax=Lacimonas salitolerans TaxID=1323750 RepID=A0ABW4EFR1_9RHOB